MIQEFLKKAKYEALWRTSGSPMKMKQNVAFCTNFDVNDGMSDAFVPLF